MKKNLTRLAIAIIILLSFRCYSALYYPLLNSDNGVSILMLHYFQLPGDFYFWGQDRVGSLIPFLGQIFFKGFNLSALASEAITHYLILIAGFLAFASFIKADFYKLVFAVIWFFPPMRFIDTIQLYSGVEYSLIALACYTFNDFQSSVQKDVGLKAHILLVLSTLLLLAAVWVSDMAIISIAILLGTQLFIYYRKHKFAWLDLKNPVVYYALAGVLGGWLLFHLAKDNSPNGLNYATFSDFATIKNSFSILWKTIVDLFVFRGDEIFTSVYAWLLVFVFLLAILSPKNFRMDVNIQSWLIFFLADAIVVFVIIMVSQWTWLNGVPRRYFTCTYISLSFVIVLFLDNSDFKKQTGQLINATLLGTVILGGIGTLYNLKYFWPKTLVPKVEVVAEFDRLGQIGIIAEYWNAYIIACRNPVQIKATPHDQQYVRSPEMVEAVFAQKNIYVIKDMWLQSFPDTLMQFNRTLIKDGNAFHIGDCEVCKYSYSKEVNTSK